jgi:hypothetical protein
MACTEGYGLKHRRLWFEAQEAMVCSTGGYGLKHKRLWFEAQYRHAGQPLPPSPPPFPRSLPLSLPRSLSPSLVPSFPPSLPLPRSPLPPSLAPFLHRSHAARRAVMRAATNCRRRSDSVAASAGPTAPRAELQPHRSRPAGPLPSGGAGLLEVRRRRTGPGPAEGREGRGAGETWVPAGAEPAGRHARTRVRRAAACNGLTHAQVTRRSRAGHAQATPVRGSTPL